jgi:hypothetical protein
VEEENDGRTLSLNCGTVHTGELNSVVLCTGSDPTISYGSKVFRIYVHLRLLYTRLYCVLYTYIIVRYVSIKVSVTFCIT